MAKSGTITPLRFATNILLRLVIVGIACLGLFNFYELVWIYDFVRPKMDAYMVMGGVLAPAFALVAIALAVANKYQWLAAPFAIISQFVFAAACC